MHILDSTPGRTCIIHGKEYLFFSGYSYLGMNHVTEFRELVKDGIEKYGVLYPSSRISNTRLAIYEGFEILLSEMTGMEETVSFSSGYLAGETISDLLFFCKNIYVAPGSHPAVSSRESVRSLESGVRSLSVRTPLEESKNFNDWKNEVTELINNSSEKEFLLIADSVNVIKSEINDPLINIVPDKKVIFLLDDSHGIGLIGSGRGISGHIRNSQDNVEYIISYSLSKAFNLQGGAVSCSSNWAKKLRQHPGYSGSTAMSPALIHAFLNSLKLYASQREKLLKNIQLLQEQDSRFLKNNSALPVFICTEEDAENKYFSRDIVISSFGYPYPHSPKINRVVLNALHTPEDIKKVSGIL